MESLLSDQHQIISFVGPKHHQIVDVVSKNVTIESPDGTHTCSSSKVALKSVVDYNWPNRYYNGELLAVHHTANYIAYAIQGNNNQQTLESTKTSMIRVLKWDNGARLLIRGINGCVEDLSFAKTTSQVVLGCVDSDGSLFVYILDWIQDKITYSLYLHVVREPKVEDQGFHRLIWCTYIPDEDSSKNESHQEEYSMLVVLTHGAKAEVWNTSKVSKKYGSGPHQMIDIDIGRLEIVEHLAPISVATFSPDGSAIATASLDGSVKFIQILNQDDGMTKPEVKFNWQPHNGRALSSLIFLDNYESRTADETYWKYALTGAEMNNEIKIWTCSTWTLLQTIKFNSWSTASSNQVCLKLAIDMSSSYLVLSDINNKVLYILRIVKDPDGQWAYVNLISKCLVANSILSMTIISAQVKKFKFYSTHVNDDQLVIQNNNQLFNRYGLSKDDQHMSSDDDDDDDDSHVPPSICIQMYIVQPKSLQDCLVLFKPDQWFIDSNNSNISKLISLTNDDLPPSQQMLSNNTLNLLTPDAFSSSTNDVSQTNGKQEQEDTKIRCNDDIDEDDDDDDDDDKLKKEMKLKIDEIELKLEQQTNIMKNIDQQINNVNKYRHNNQATLITTMQQILNGHLSKQNELIDLSMKQLTMTQIQFQDKLIANLNQIVDNKLSSNIEMIVKRELERIVSGELSTICGRSRIKEDEMRQHELFERLMEKTDQLLIDNVDKLIRSKQFYDAYANVLLTTVKPQIANLFQDVMLTKFLPTFENVAQQMFRQMSDVFSKGTKHYINTLETQLSRQSDADLTTAGKHLMDNFKHELLMNNQWLFKNIDTSLLSFQEKFQSAVAQQIKREMDETNNKLTAANQSMMIFGSRAITPSPLDIQMQQAQLDELISRGDLNAAFQQALNASNLSLVVYLCEKVNPQQVFNQQPCPLQQHVLLSLIQQLSADMDNHTEIKYKYLEEAVINLDVSNAMTREHMPIVIKELQRKLNGYITSGSNCKMARQMKLLLLATQALNI